MYTHQKVYILVCAYILKMRVYEFQREKRIEEIVDLLREMAIAQEPMDKKKLLNAISSKYNISKRTAGEYLGVAIFRNVSN